MDYLLLVRQKASGIPRIPFMQTLHPLAMPTGERSMSTRYGYIRVSSSDQNEDRQVRALAAQDIDSAHIYMDKLSGKDFQRPQYQNLLRCLLPGDQLYIVSLDRLGRNYEDVLKHWRLLTKIKKVDIVVLDMPLLNTRQHRDLLGSFIVDIVLQILSFVAQNERENIRKRQADGIAAAKLRGVRFGQPPRPLPENFEEVYSCWQAGQISTAEAARRTSMPRSTFRYKARVFSVQQEKKLL